MTKETYEKFADLLGYTAFNADYKIVTKGKNLYSEDGKDFSTRHSINSIVRLYREVE